MYRTAGPDRLSPPMSPAAIGLAGLVVALGWVLWATTGLASVLSGRPASIGLTDLASVVVHLPAHLSDPTAAYGGELRPHLPPAGLWWFALTLVVITTCGLVVAGTELYGRRRPVSSDARWASGWDLRPLRVRQRSPGRLVLGTVGGRRSPLKPVTR